MAEATHDMFAARAGVARHGAAGDPGVIVAPLPSAGIAYLVARNGARAALGDAARAAFGVPLPPPAGSVRAGELALLWCGPDRWLAVATPAPAAGMAARLAAVAGLAAIIEHSHGTLLLRVGGRSVRDALAKGVAIDLHPRAFTVGQVALTAVAHIPLAIWQTGDEPRYVLLLPRSYAPSFADWLSAAAAEFGLELAGAASTP